MILVFVYLGKSIPKYVLANLRQVTTAHPDKRLVFIGDNDGVCRKVANKGYEVWKSTDPEETWVINRDSLAHNPDFRDGFWFKTLARFFALNEFLKTCPNQPALLIESDVWISSTFPMEGFSKDDFEFAFPLTTLNQGVASTFFVKSQSSMQSFLNFASKRVLENSNSTDVSILAEFWQSNQEDVYILPSGPKEPSAYNESFQSNEPTIMSNSTLFPGQFFDASTWGQFLTGEDPRNSWGIRILYHMQPHHAVNPQKFSFSVEGDEKFAYYMDSKYRINSLHIHSKDIRVFRKNNFLNSRLTNFHGTQNCEIVWRYFLKFLPYRLKHELRHFSVRFK